MSSNNSSSPSGFSLNDDFPSLSSSASTVTAPKPSRGAWGRKGKKASAKQDIPVATNEVPSMEAADYSAVEPTSDETQVQEAAINVDSTSVIGVASSVAFDVDHAEELFSKLQIKSSDNSSCLPTSSDFSSHPSDSCAASPFGFFSATHIPASSTVWNHSSTSFNSPYFSSASSDSTPLFPSIIENIPPTSSSKDIIKDFEQFVANPVSSISPVVGSFEVAESSSNAPSLLPSIASTAEISVPDDTDLDFPSLSTTSSTSLPVWGPSLKRSLIRPDVSEASGSGPSEEIPFEEPKLENSRQMSRLSKGTNITLVSNCYHIFIDSITIYCFKVEIVKLFKTNSNATNTREERKMVLTGAKGNTFRTKAQLSKVLEIVFKKAGLKDVPYAYDGARSLYLTSTLKQYVKKNVLKKSLSHHDLPTTLKDALFGESFGTLEVTIEPSEGGKTLELADILKEDVTNPVNSVRTMVQISLIQKAVNGDKFVALEKNVLFETVKSEESAEKKTKKQKPNEPFDKKKLERIGLGLGIKIGEGEDGNANVLLCLDHKKSNFFIAGPLVDVKDYLPVNFTDHRTCRKVLKGLEVKPCYSNRLMNLETFSMTSIGGITFKKDNETQSILESAANLARKRVEEYNKEFVAVQKQQGKILYSFPIENLNVVENQRMGQQHGNPPPPSPPQERFEETRRLGEKANVLKANSVLESFKIEINPTPIEVVGKTLTPPQILYSKRDGFISVPIENASWKPTGDFVVRSDIRSVLILYYNDDKAEDISHHVRAFKKDLIAASVVLKHPLAEGSVRIENMKIEAKGQSPEKNLENRLIKMKQASDNSFVIYIDKKRNNPSHGFVKLQERLNERIVQHVASDEALKRTGRGSNVINFILMKMNVKCGGMNHRLMVDQSIGRLWGERSNTLVISYDVCHASGTHTYKKGQKSLEPSVVGFGFNGARHPEQVIGDFHIQERGKEEVSHDILVEKTIWMLETYFDSRRKCPENIVVLRDGVSAGQYPMAKFNELKAITEGVHKFMNKRGSLKRPNISFIIATKRHANRLVVKSEDGLIQNVPPLTAVDRKIVRKNGNEIIFISHCPLTGTAQPVMLNTLFNEVFRSHDELINLVSALCCAHQRCTSIISLPETIFVADAYAKRGADMYEAYKKRIISGEKGDLSLKNRTVEDYERITKILSYKESKMFHGRCMI